jgi:pathogenesis-related protein 1
MRPLVLCLVLAGCSAPAPVGDCSPMNCGGCCDALGQCQSGSSSESCGSSGFRCLVCGQGQRCGASSSCELDPNAPRAGGSAGSGGGQAGLTAYQQSFVTAHNLARRTAAPAPNPPLADVTWDPAAEAFARVGADRCLFDHRQQNQFGENLFASTQDDSPAEVVESWDGEKADYRYASNTCTAVCGHYTQVVWRSSTKIGCATARCTTNSPFRSFPTWYLTACNYSPPGNVVGQKPY